LREGLQLAFRQIPMPFLNRFEFADQVHLHEEQCYHLAKNSLESSVPRLYGRHAKNRAGREQPLGGGGATGSLQPVGAVARADQPPVAPKPEGVRQYPNLGVFGVWGQSNFLLTLD
jgi:hypothetical protein